MKQEELTAHCSNNIDTVQLNTYWEKFCRNN